MRRAALRLLGATFGLLALAGCGGTSDRALHLTLAALRASASAQSSAANTPGAKSNCGQIDASLRPRGILPRPGSMPAGSFMAKIQQRGRLIAGVDQNTLLFAYLNPSNGRLEEFEIDILREVARAIFGNPDAIEFKAITTAQRLSAVQDGTVDIVADAVTITCARRAQVAFSTVYFDARQRVLVPSDSPARSISDLGGKRVCATRSSTSIENIKRLQPRAIPYEVAQRTDCLVDLEQGVVDAISTDDAILLGFKDQDPYTKIVGPRFSDEPYGMAIAKDHADLVRFVNGVLARIRADGTWRAIYARWPGRLVSTPDPPKAHYVA